MTTTPRTRKAPGIGELEKTADYKWRMARMERHVLGTEDKNYQDGLVVWRENLDKRFVQIKRLIHLWGSALMAGFIASGAVGSHAAHVLGAFLQGMDGK